MRKAPKPRWCGTVVEGLSWDEVEAALGRIGWVGVKIQVGDEVEEGFLDEGFLGEAAVGTAVWDTGGAPIRDKATGGGASETRI